MVDQLENGRIVVGIDGSDASLAALEWALNSARRRNAKVVAVTGFDIPWTMNITPPYTVNDYARDTETLLERTAAPAPLMPGSGTVSRALQVRPSHAVAGDSDTR